MEKSAVLHIRIAPGLKEKLKALADADGRSMSGYVERLILRDLQAATIEAARRETD